MKVFLRNYKPFEQYFRIKFQKPKAKIHTNGFISVVVDWSSKKDCIDFWRFKYPELTHTTYGGDFVEKRKKYLNVRSVAFVFPDLEDVKFDENKKPSWFEISFGVETQEEFDKNELEYLYFDQTKYGVIAWFAPRNWKDWENAKDF